MAEINKNGKRQISKIQGHVVYNDEEISMKKKKSENQNTVKSEERGDRAFQRFLTQCNADSTEYWLYTEPELDSYLAKFYLGAREFPNDDDPSFQEDPEQKSRKYSGNSLKNFCYALNRILKSKGHLYDIISKDGTSFKKCNQAYKVAMQELKDEGRAEVKSHPEIKEDGNFHVYFHHFCPPSSKRNVNKECWLLIG